MHEDHAHALLGEAVQELPLPSVGADVVGIDYDGVCTLHDGLILLGPVGPQDGGPDLESTLFVEGLGQQRATGIEFVFARTVTAISCDEYDMLDLLVFLVGEEKRTEEGEQERDHQGDAFHG